MALGALVLLCVALVIEALKLLIRIKSVQGPTQSKV